MNDTHNPDDTRHDTTTSKTMSMSLQLPDLLSYCSVFELRTNKHCKTVSQASEKWLLESAGVVLDSGMAWSAAKPGLLAAACHPSADPTQLRFVADFLGLWLYHRECSGVGRGRCCAVVGTDECGGEEAQAVDPFVHLSDRLSRAAHRYPRWYLRFAQSRRQYLEAGRRHSNSKNRAQVVPDLETYIERRRDASGFRMALDMVQYAGDVDVPDTLMGDASFGRLHDHACDIAAWSEDILSFAKGMPAKNEANIVTILMRERNISLECAVSAAGMLVKQGADAFIATEEALLSIPDFAADREVRRYLRGLRDWIAGVVNWMYETRLFLGDKGNEVRAFGWVFIDVPVSP